MGESDAAVIAAHAERGGERGRAARLYRRAAEQAIGGNDVAAAVAYCERGLACDPDQRGTILVVLAMTHKLRGDNPGARAAMALLPRGSEDWFAAAAEAVTACGKLAEVESLTQLVDELGAAGLVAAPAHAAALARAATQAFILGDPPVAARALGFLDGMAATLDGEPAVRGWLVSPRAPITPCRWRPAAPPKPACR